MTIFHWTHFMQQQKQKINVNVKRMPKKTMVPSLKSLPILTFVPVENQRNAKLGLMRWAFRNATAKSLRKKWEKGIGPLLCNGQVQKRANTHKIRFGEWKARWWIIAWTHSTRDKLQGAAKKPTLYISVLNTVVCKPFCISWWNIFANFATLRRQKSCPTKYGVDTNLRYLFDSW